MKETGSCKAQRETGCTARTGSQPVSRLKGIGEKTEKLFLYITLLIRPHVLIITAFYICQSHQGYNQVSR